MSVVFALVKRNVKLFFKDKGMFFASLITPGILLVLYATFLKNVYHDSFTSNLPEFITLSKEVIDGLVGGQLISSILAVSCVTVAFCSNFLMVQDKVTGTIKDLRISPVKPAVLGLSYYIATLASTLLICFVAMAICLVYLAIVGWYLSVADVFLLLLDVVLLAFFGTALSSIINFFLSSQGQISAVGTIISAGYGFICGAYMPISSFGSGLQKVLSFLPGTYGTSLIRNHAMNGALDEMQNQGVPAQVVASIRDSMDCNLYFFEDKVEVSTMYGILATTVALLVGIYVLMNSLKKKIHGVGFVGLIEHADGLAGEVLVNESCCHLTLVAVSEAHLVAVGVGGHGIAGGGGSQEEHIVIEGQVLELQSGLGGNGTQGQLHAALQQGGVVGGDLGGVVHIVGGYQLELNAVQTAGGVDLVNSHLGGVGNSLAVHGGTAGQRTGNADHVLGIVCGV